MGIRSPVSSNPSMILGGLKTGVSALDMAHAYSTAANGGMKVYNPKLGDGNGPIGIDSISNCRQCDHGEHTITNIGTMKTRQVITPDVAATIDELLHGPVDDSYGTGTAAAIPGVDVAGKTGTTSNYVDAWFVGWTPNLTVAVWVGYPNSGKPMLTDYNGKPVEGGTYPAVIWHDFMVGAIADHAGGGRQQAESDHQHGYDLLTTHDRRHRQHGHGHEHHQSHDHDTELRDHRERTAADDHAQRPIRRRRPPPNESATVPATTPPPPPRDRAPAPTAAQDSERVRTGTDRYRLPAHTEPPGQLDRPRDPDPAVPLDLRIAEALRTPCDHYRPARQITAVVGQRDAERLRELPGPRAQSAQVRGIDPAALRHQLDPAERLERPDQHSSADALGLADRVEHRVDAVGAVDVGPPGRSEQRLGARREADERVRRRLAVVVGLGLDDHAAALAAADDAADQRLGHLQHGSSVESGPQRALPHGYRRALRARSSAARACSSCSRTADELVPPREAFDSSQAPSASSA